MTIRSKICNFFNSGTKSKVTVNDVFLKCKTNFYSSELFCILMLSTLVFLVVQAFTGMGLEILSRFTSYEVFLTNNILHIWTLTEYIIGFAIGVISIILLFSIVILAGYCVIKFFKLFEKPFVYVINMFKSIYNKVGSIKLISCDLKDD